MELPQGYSVVVDPESGRKIIVINESWKACEESLEKYFDYNVHGGIPALEAIRNRADINEVISFANDIRAAGGGSFIDSLMPSTPMEPNSCLIANALNFDCEVNSYDGNWYMKVDNTIVGEKIAIKLGLDYDYEDYDENEEDEPYTDCEILLPEPIGYVAEAFDTACDYELEQYNEQNIARKSFR